MNGSTFFVFGIVIIPILCIISVTAKAFLPITVTVSSLPGIYSSTIRILGMSEATLVADLLLDLQNKRQ